MKIDLQLPQNFFDEESREIRVSSDVKKIWAVELDLLVKFDEVCRRNGIQYFIDGGSLLGAVRHKGFIPWDDDIDVCMFRKDFKRLEAIAAKEFKKPYFWQTFKTDLLSARGHGTLRNSDTTAIPKDDLINGKTVRQFNNGVFIDVFPLDNIPDSEDIAIAFLVGIQKRMDKVRFLASFPAILRARGWRVLTSARGCLNLFRYSMSCFWAILHGENALSRAAWEHERWCERYNSGRTSRSCTISFWPMRKQCQYYRREWFEEITYLDFELLKLPAPSGYIKLLEGLYGDWRKHVIGGSLHDGIFFDVEHPYTDYFRK